MNGIIILIRRYAYTVRLWIYLVKVIDVEHLMLRCYNNKRFFYETQKEKTPKQRFLQLHYKKKKQNKSVEATKRRNESTQILCAFVHSELFSALWPHLFHVFSFGIPDGHPIVAYVAYTVCQLHEMLLLRSLYLPYKFSVRVFMLVGSCSFPGIVYM